MIFASCADDNVDVQHECSLSALASIGVSSVGLCDLSLAGHVDVDFKLTLQQTQDLIGGHKTAA